MATPADSRPEEEREALLRFVERFALILAENGMPRMVARVFAYTLADDAERYSATELAEGLQVSPAAISGAVRTLVQMGLLGKEREPGSRTDTYRVYDDDVWGAITRQRLPVLDRWEEGLAEGLQTLPEGRPGWRRLRETQAYFEFVREEFDGMLQRWADRRKKLLEEG